MYDYHEGFQYLCIIVVICVCVCVCLCVQGGWARGVHVWLLGIV